MRFSPTRLVRDPASRPRVIIWSLLALIGFVLLWAAGLIGTSTYWFCTTPCHIVHDDNTLAYQASTHRQVACVACHEPVNASPVEFTLMKVYVLPDLPATIFKTFSLPMNEGNEVAKEIPEEQCTQCHNLENRTATPSRGILIDHEAHSSREIKCTVCHNRVAHNDDDVTFILKGDRKHENWMKMDGCFRCHGLDEKSAKAPGSCGTCHPKTFELEPKTHQAKDWYHQFGDSSGHAKAALEESRSVAAALKLASNLEKESDHPAEGAFEGLPPSSGVNSCYTCHKRAFCDDCHGMQVPHPASFKKEHAKAGYANPATCAKCHARSAAEAVGLNSCNACHHPASRPGVDWRYTHPAEVRAKGGKPCYRCHAETFCAGCHVKVSTGKIPSSQGRLR